jgi:hypothetical protein
VHLKSVIVALLKVGRALVRVGSKLPRQLVLPYLGERPVLPHHIEQVTRELLVQTPYVARSSAVDDAYALHRTALLPAPQEDDAAEEDGEAWRWPTAA